MPDKENQKISMRKVKREDLGILRDWRNHEEISRFFSQFHPLNMIHQKKWWDTINSKNSKSLMFVVNLENKPIGVCGFINIDKPNRNSDIAIIIGIEKLHGKGIGSVILKKLVDYGFHKLNLNRIGADIVEFNHQSFNLFKKLNFEEEAIIRESLWRYGKWWNTHKLSLLRQYYLRNP